MHFGTVFDLGWPPRLKAGFQFPARDLSQVVAVRALNPNHWGLMASGKCLVGQPFRNVFPDIDGKY